MARELRFRYDAQPGRVVFGAGTARTELAGALERLGVERALVVVSRSAEPAARRLADSWGARVAGWFTDVRQHVPAATAEAARASAAAVAADALVSVGGGSAVGTAKAVALTSGLPIVAVPTTYAGSEMTPMWGLTEGDRKRTGTDVRVLPRTVVYDPELTVGLPAAVSAASGLNAMAHGVEAFWAPGRNPVSSLAAAESIGALVRALPAVAHDGSDLAARTKAMYGAYLAGSAFAVTGSGLHHKICHVLGGAYNLPHAETHAIVLPYVTAYNAPEMPDATERIARALDASDAAVALRQLSATLGIPRGLREIGLREYQLEEAARLIEPVVPRDNPRPAGLAALRQILHAAWAGEAPRFVSDPG